MARPTIRDLLIQTAIDHTERDRFLQNPHFMLRRFGVSDAHGAILRAGDERVLALLGEAIRGMQPAPTELATTAQSAPQTAPHTDAEKIDSRPSASPVRLILRLGVDAQPPHGAPPGTDAGTQEGWKLTYQAALSACDDAAMQQAIETTDEPAWLIELTPHFVDRSVEADAKNESPPQEAALTFAATIQPLTVLGPGGAKGEGTEGERPRGWSPWAHETSTPAVHEAAAHVATLTGDARFDGVCKLVRAMQPGGGRG